MDIRPEVGITATPVIDRASSTVYVSAETKDADGQVHHHLQAIDLATGGIRQSTEIGATVTSGSIDIGRRNILAARRVLWQNGMMVSGEVVGGTDVRTVSLSNQYGRVEIRNGRDVIQELCA